MDIEKAMLNPAQVFDHPEDILKEESLTHEQKVKLLKRWEYDARELEVAEEENMGGSSPSVLGEILVALNSLDAGGNTGHFSPTKQGGE